jgi:hypothetical protein
MIFWMDFCELSTFFGWRSFMSCCPFWHFLWACNYEKTLAYKCSMPSLHINYKVFRLCNFWKIMTILFICASGSGHGGSLASPFSPKSWRSSRTHPTWCLSSILNTLACPLIQVDAVWKLNSGQQTTHIGLVIVIQNFVTPHWSQLHVSVVLPKVSLALQPEAFGLQLGTHIGAILCIQDEDWFMDNRVILPLLQPMISYQL